VEQKAKAMLIMAVTLGTLVLAGFVGVSYTDAPSASHSPNNQANHHSRHLTD
jgi:hypothetical protein